MSIIAPDETLDLVGLDLLHDLSRRPEWGRLGTIFDAEAMQHHLQQAFFSGSPYTIERCIPDTPIYLVNEDACVLIFELVVRDEAAGRQINTLANGRVFATQAACEHYVRQELAPVANSGQVALWALARPVAVVADLHLALSLFPIDEVMPTIVAAMDPPQATAVLQQALHDQLEDGETITGCQVELIRYKHRRSCVLRYEVAGSRGRTLLAYGKISFHEDDLNVLEAMANLRAHMGRHYPDLLFHIPRPLGYWPTLDLSLFTPIPGSAKDIYRLLKQVLGWEMNGKQRQVTLEDALTACAHIAGVMHTADLPHGRCRPFTTELAQLQTAVAEVGTITPPFGCQLQEWLGQIEAYAAATSPLPLCFNHGDFTYKQLLLDGSVGGLVDFDTACQAEPAFDLGHFLAYLRIAIYRLQKTTPDNAAALTNRLYGHFLETYLVASGRSALFAAQLRRRVLLYEALALLRITIHSWQKFKGTRLGFVIASLEDVFSQWHTH